MWTSRSHEAKTTCYETDLLKTDSWVSYNNVFDHNEHFIHPGCYNLNEQCINNIPQQSQPTLPHTSADRWGTEDVLFPRRAWHIAPHSAWDAAERRRARHVATRSPHTSAVSEPSASTTRPPRTARNCPRLTSSVHIEYQRWVLYYCKLGEHKTACCRQFLPFWEIWGVGSKY